LTIKGGVHTIREGITNQYVMPATILAFLAAIGFVYIGLLSILIAMVALALFLSVSGIEIDTRLLRYRKYKVIAGIKFGKWSPFTTNDSFQLWLSSESGRYMYTTYGTTPAFVAPTNFYNGNKSKSITYDLILVLATGEKHIVNDFFKYSTAKKALSVLESAGCATRDKIIEKLNENNKRSRRL